VATYLFAWNPIHWNWPELSRQVRKLERRGHVDIQWSSGRIRAIEPGSRAFMIRLGVPPKGIIGAGYTLTAPETGEHWVEAKAKAGIPGLYLKLRLEVLRELPAVNFDDLARPPFSRFRWGIRQSGTRVPSSLAEQLEVLWEKRVQDVAAARGGKAVPVAVKADRSGSRRRGRRG